MSERIYTQEELEQLIEEVKEAAFEEGRTIGFREGDEEGYARGYVEGEDGGEAAGKREVCEHPAYFVDEMAIQDIPFDEYMKKANIDIDDFLAEHLEARDVRGRFREIALRNLEEILDRLEDMR